MSTLSAPVRAGFDELGEGVEKARTEYDAAGRPRRAFRTDIQGLRAVAVLAVVLYHAGVPFVPGGYVGVDVFLVISGFLITGHLLAEVERTGTVSLSGFYARRIRRLLPLALLVVVSTLLVAALWGPVLQVSRTAHDGLFATFYAMNYHLAAQGVDYQLANAAPSPFQHFWSLAVEEQFYLLWPLLIVLVAMATRKLPPARRRLTLSVVLLVVVAASLKESITLTASNGPLAYYSLQSRAWELAAGALVAAAVPLLGRAPALLATAATWLGLLMIGAGAVLFDDATAFPGWVALLPVGGAVMVVAGGVRSQRNGAIRVLRHRSLQFIGAVSYGWYLWHWPAIVLGPGLWGTESGVVEKLLLSVLALWFAVLGYLLVEQPSLRTSSRLRTWVAAAAAMSLAVTGVALAATAIAPSTIGSGAEEQLDLRYPSTSVLSSAITAGLRRSVTPRNLEPTLVAAAADVPPTTRDGCHLDFLDVEQPPCVFGDPAGSRTMVLFGDSHAEQWFGALNAYATISGWRLISWTKAACPLADVVLPNEKLRREYTECGEWRSQRLRAIARLHPDLVVTSQSNALPGSAYPVEDWAEETARTVTDLKAGTDHLLFLGDTPYAGREVPACLAENPSDPRGCTLDYDPARYDAVAEQLAGLGVQPVDVSPLFCVGRRCPAVVGNVLVYRDDSHMTQTYSKALEPLMAQVLADATKETP